MVFRCALAVDVVCDTERSVEGSIVAGDNKNTSEFPVSVRSTIGLSTGGRNVDSATGIILRVVEV